jgi:hypothetical protein
LVNARHVASAITQQAIAARFSHLVSRLHRPVEGAAPSAPGRGGVDTRHPGDEIRIASDETRDTGKILRDI